MARFRKTPCPVSTIDAVSDITLWILNDGRHCTDIISFVTAFAECLLRNDVPVWRIYLGLRRLHPPAINFKPSVDAYREAAERSGFDPATLPIATTSLFYVGDTTKEALQGMYPHIYGGFQAIRGGGYPKQQFAQAPDTRDALMVGSTQEIIEKMLYQYELYRMQRFMAQVDFGGVPFEKIMKNIEIIGNDIIPAIKKYTAKS